MGFRNRYMYIHKMVSPAHNISEQGRRPSSIRKQFALSRGKFQGVSWSAAVVVLATRMLGEGFAWTLVSDQLRLGRNQLSRSRGRGASKRNNVETERNQEKVAGSGDKNE